MEDHRLRAFCLIVEMKSFSKAAEAKFMTQSAMSHLIKNLEEELGMNLLIRKGKTVMPTPAGRALYDHAQQILMQYKNMENDLYASAIAAKYLLPQVFYDFSKKYNEVQVNLSVSNTEKITNGLLQGEIDIGIAEGSEGTNCFG